MDSPTYIHDTHKPEENSDTATARHSLFGSEDEVDQDSEDESEQRKSDDDLVPEYKWRWVT